MLLSIFNRWALKEALKEVRGYDGLMVGTTDASLSLTRRGS